jgi:serine phosphatase RsbU (regulator of sigma subunit)
LSPSLRAIRWRLIFSSVIVLLLALGSFYLNQWVYASADDQCTWRVEKGRVLIQEVLPNGAAEDAGLLEGDEMLLVHGRRVAPPDLDKIHRFIEAQPEGRILVYTVRRDGRTLRLPVKLVKPFNITSVIVLGSALVGWLTGLLVVISSPSRKSARHLFYMGLVSLLMSLWFPLGLNTLPTPFLVPLVLFAGLGAGLGPPLWVHFFLRFPHPFPLRTNRRFLTALYASFLAGAYLLLADLLLRTRDHPAAFQGLMRLLDSPAAAALTAILVPSAMLAGLGLFWIGTRRRRPRRRRELLPALVVTTLILADLLTYRFFLMRTGGTSLLFNRGSWIYFTPLPLLPLSFAFAIFRHGLFDVRRAILRWLSYFVVLGLILAVYLGGLALLSAEGLQALPSGWAGLLVGLSALPIGWLLRYLVLALRRKFRRDLTTAREVIQGRLRNLRERFSEPAILETLADGLREAFRPQLLLLLPAEGQGFRLPPAPFGSDGRRAGGSGQSLLLALPPGVLRQARDNRELVLGLQSDEADWIREQGPELRAHVDALEAQVLALVMVNEEPCAAVVLGGKYAELNFSRDDRELLREVAHAAGLMLETARSHGRLLDQGRIEQELHTARLIQQSLITSQVPGIEGFQVALRLEPALETGGDLLWVGRRPAGQHLAAVGDVSGKGLPAALYMSQAAALLTFAAQQETLGFSQILPTLDKALRSILGRKDFLTLGLLEWDASGRFRVVRAGHPPILLVAGDGPGEVQELPSRGVGLGLRPAYRGEWQVIEGLLRPGQWLVMYSDGLTEAMNKSGEVYGLPRLAARIQELWRGGSAAEACATVFHDVAAYEAQNRDDRTLFILARDRS